MINVSNATKEIYKISSNKNLKVYFPELEMTIGMNHIDEESFKLDEKTEKDSYLMFTGCNSSFMSIVFVGITENFKGRKVEVSITAGNTDEIPVFKGIVDSQKITDYDEGRSEIKAYDVLYSKGQTDIANWYKAIEFPITLKQYRESLFTYLDLDYVDADLVNDDIEIAKQYSPSSMKALDSIRAICQINGAFGIINREGLFEFRTLTPIDVNEDYDVIPFYKKINYQRYSVQSIGKVTVRQNTSDEGASYGEGGNIYVVQGNIFTLNLEPEVIALIAENLYGVVSGISYVPYTAESYATPWIECGDVIKYQVYDYKTDTYSPLYAFVFSRRMKGIQAITDTFTADGEEFQTVFVSDLRVQITTIQNQIESIQGKMNKIELKYLMFYNEQAVDVADGQTKPIANIRFGVSNSGQVYIELEYLIECETTEETVGGYLTDNDLVVTLLYEYDGTIIDSRQPKETYQDGKHILHAYYVVDVDNTTLHNWKVWLNCVGGSVHIDIYQAQNTILGLGLIGQTSWDGTITVSDELAPIVIPTIPIRSMIDNAIVRLITPTEINVSDAVSPVDILTIGVASITDEADIDEVVTNAYVDESNVAEMTFDANYVEIRNHSFVEKIEWTSLGASEPIDSGYCTKVTPFVTDVTVDDVEII